MIMGKSCAVFGDHHLDDLNADDVMDFLNRVTDGCKPQTKRIRTDIYRFVGVKHKF